MLIGSNESVVHSISNFTIGSGAVSYKVDKYTECTTNLTVKVGNVTVATRSNTSGTSAGDKSLSITFSSSELTSIYNAMPKVSKATFLFTVTSYVDGANIGSTSATAIGTLPASMKPSISKVTLTDSNSAIASKFGAFVKDKSRLNYDYTTSASAGSTISSYNLTINDVPYTGKTGTTNTINKSGAVNYSAYVVDSRGRKSDVFEGTINVLDYYNPKMTTFKVIRCNASGVEDQEGLYAKYTVNSSVAPVNNLNTKSFVIDFKKENDTEWTQWKAYSSSYTFSETSAVKAIEEGAYHFRLTITDFFNSEGVNKIVYVASTFVAFEWMEDLNGVAFGKMATDDDTFDIGFGKTKLSKITYVGGAEYPEEKSIMFPNPDDSQYPHASKLYGGNATSPVAIGIWDTLRNSPVFQYMDNVYRLKFGEGIQLDWGNYPIEAILEKAMASMTGQIHTKEGLLIQWGTVSIAGGAGTPTSTEVIFPKTYDFIPFICESAVSTVPATVVQGVAHGNDSASGTTIYVTRTNTASTSVRWMAIGYSEV